MYHKLVGGNQSFSCQMEIMNDRSIVVLENKSKVVDFLVFFCCHQTESDQINRWVHFYKIECFLLCLGGLSFIAYANIR